MNPKTPHYLNVLIATGSSAHKLMQFIGDGLDLNRIIAEPEWFKPLISFTHTDIALYYYLTNKLSTDLTSEQADRYFVNIENPFKFEFNTNRLHIGAIRELTIYESQNLYEIGSFVARMVEEFNVSTVSAWRMKYWGCYNPEVQAETTEKGIVFKTPYSPPAAAIHALAKQLNLTLKHLFTCSMSAASTDIDYIYGNDLAV